MRANDRTRLERVHLAVLNIIQVTKRCGVGADRGVAPHRPDEEVAQGIVGDEGRREDLPAGLSERQAVRVSPNSPFSGSERMKGKGKPPRAYLSWRGIP